MVVAYKFHHLLPWDFVAQDISPVVKHAFAVLKPASVSFPGNIYVAAVCGSVPRMVKENSELGVDVQTFTVAPS